MPLLERLMGTEEPKIAVHQFVAGMHEVMEGQFTMAQFRAAFDANQTALDADFTWLQGRATAAINAGRIEEFAERLHYVFMLAEGGFAYTTRPQIAARMDQAF